MLRSAFDDDHDAAAAGAVERLDDRDAELRDEAMDAVAVARHERARHVRREVQSVELLVGLAQPARVVQDERATAQVLEHQREIEVLRVEGWILSNEDALDVGEAHVTRFAEREVRRGVAHTNLARASPHVAALDVHVTRFAVQTGMPAPLGGALEGERRVLVAEDSLDRVHHVDEAHRAPSIADAAGRATLQRSS